MSESPIFLSTTDVSRMREWLPMNTAPRSVTDAREWLSPYGQQKGLRRLRTRIADLAARFLCRMGLRVQSRMDIDPRSTWYDPQYVDRCDTRDLSSTTVTPERRWADKHDLVRRDMLLILSYWLKRRGVTGAVAEVGVARGMTASLLCSAFPDSEVFLFDTFSGYPDEDVAEERRVTGMSVDPFPFTTTVTEVRALIGCPERVHIVEGRFPESVQSPWRASGRFALVHIDVDLYRPVSAALNYFWPLMQPGGFMVVHDYNAWPGAHRAVDEFLHRHPHAAVPMPDKSGSIVICSP